MFLPQRIHYGPRGNLHATWVWRESSQGANHDLIYCYSQDRGETWRNNRGNPLPGPPSAYRLAKQTAQDHGDYRAAGDYYFAEQCAINCRMRKEATGRRLGNRPVWRVHRQWGKFWEGARDTLWAYGEFVFGNKVFGYGERPTYPLRTGGAVILLWSLFYWFGGIVDGKVVDPATKEETPKVVYDLWTSLYFSVVTFTTLGYGDLKPPPGIMRGVAATEAFFGACLMALFIVCLARKFTR